MLNLKASKSSQVERQLCHIRGTSPTSFISFFKPDRMTVTMIVYCWFGWPWWQSLAWVQWSALKIFALPKCIFLHFQDALCSFYCEFCGGGEGGEGVAHLTPPTPFLAINRALGAPIIANPISEIKLKLELGKLNLLQNRNLEKVHLPKSRGWCQGRGSLGSFYCSLPSHKYKYKYKYKWIKSEICKRTLKGLMPGKEESPWGDVICRLTQIRIRIQIYNKNIKYK